MAVELNHCTIEGRGIRLEPISNAHAEGLYAIGQEVDDWKFLPRPAFASLDDAQSWIKEALELKQNRQHYTYTVIDIGSGRVMGSSRYLNIAAHDNTLEIGYTFLGRPFQRTRVNTTMKYLMLEHAFSVLSTRRVELRTDGRNQRSQKAIERIGAIKEGVLRKHRIVQNGFVRDTVVYSILGEEWKALKTNFFDRYQ